MNKKSLPITFYKKCYYQRLWNLIVDMKVDIDKGYYIYCYYSAKDRYYRFKCKDSKKIYQLKEYYIYDSIEHFPSPLKDSFMVIDYLGTVDWVKKNSKEIDSVIKLMAFL